MKTYTQNEIEAAAAKAVATYLRGTIGIKKVSGGPRSFRVHLTGITGTGRKSAYLQLEEGFAFFGYESFTAPIPNADLGLN